MEEWGAKAGEEDLAPKGLRKALWLLKPFTMDWVTNPLALYKENLRKWR